MSETYSFPETKSKDEVLHAFKPLSEQGLEECRRKLQQRHTKMLQSVASVLDDNLKLTQESLATKGTCTFSLPTQVYGQRVDITVAEFVEILVKHLESHGLEDYIVDNTYRNYVVITLEKGKRSFAAPENQP